MEESFRLKDISFLRQAEWFGKTFDQPHNLKG
jgi:hypothetical protein